MASPQDDDRDEDFFKEVYGKEYTGPTNPRENNKATEDTKKRAPSNSIMNAGDSDEQEPVHDPNAVPTDFTSREAKVWEAKAKAIERNWKRKKEEELTCRICGETGHFPQGCPSTLGVKRRTNEVVETIPVRDKRLRPRIIGSGGSVIQNLEKDTGCRLRLEDCHSGNTAAFTICISGPDRFIVKKAVGVLTNFLNQLEDETKEQTMKHSQSSYAAPQMYPVLATETQHVDRRQPNPNALSIPGHNEMSSLNDNRAGKERFVSHFDNQKMWDGVPFHALNGSSHTFANYNLTKGRDAPAAGTLSSTFDGKDSIVTMDDRGPYNHDEFQSRRGLHGPNDYPYNQEQKQEVSVRYDTIHLPQTLEELERMFLFETRQLSMDQNAEEDKERTRHHERMREIHEHYQQNLLFLRGKHMQQRDDFLQNDKVRKQQYQHQSGYDNHAPFENYGGSPFENRGRSDPHLLYSTTGEPYQDREQQQESSSYAYGRKRGSQSYGKNQTHESGSYTHDEAQRYPSYR